MTAAERRALPDFHRLAEAAADKFGVCRRPIAMRVHDPVTGTTEYVGAPCKATLEHVCPACADRARRLRVQQCREGWHLDAEPVDEVHAPSERQIQFLSTRADLGVEYQAAKRDGDTELMAAISHLVVDLDLELHSMGLRGRLPSLDPQPKSRRHRSTRRRQDAPDLPRRRVDRKTLGRVFAGRFRPSMMITLTLPSYGKVHRDGAKNRKGLVCGDGSPVDPDSYDYTSAARDVVHFAALVDRFMQNLRRAVGWDIQYYGVVEPQRRGAPHIHLLIRGTVPKELVRQVAAGTYQQAWWPHHDQEQYSDGRMPVWDFRAGTFTDSQTGEPLPGWDEALDILATVDDMEPAHVARFGSQIDPANIRGVLGNSEDAGRHIGYVTKYLTKSIGEILEPPNQRTADHYTRLHHELQRTPCSPTCGVWLRYGIVPKGATAKTIPGRCRGKAHRRDLLGLPGRRVLNSRRWTGKTLPDHQADRAEFVRQLLAKVGMTVPDTSHLQVAPMPPGDDSAPPRAQLILASIAQRSARRAVYHDALSAMGPPEAQDISAISAAA